MLTILGDSKPFSRRRSLRLPKNRVVLPGGWVLEGVLDDRFQRFQELIPSTTGRGIGSRIRHCFIIFCLSYFHFVN